MTFPHQHSAEGAVQTTILQCEFPTLSYLQVYPVSPLLGLSFCFSPFSIHHLILCFPPFLIHHMLITPPSSGRSPEEAPLQVWNLLFTQNLKCSNAHQTRTRPLGWSPKWHGTVFAEPNNQEVILPSMTTLSLRPPPNGISVQFTTRSNALTSDREGSLQLYSDRGLSDTRISFEFFTQSPMRETSGQNIPCRSAANPAAHPQFV